MEEQRLEKMKEDDLTRKKELNEHFEKFCKQAKNIDANIARDEKHPNADNATSVDMGNNKKRTSKKDKKQLHQTQQHKSSSSHIDSFTKDIVNRNATEPPKSQAKIKKKAEASFPPPALSIPLSIIKKVESAGSKIASKTSTRVSTNSTSSSIANSPVISPKVLTKKERKKKEKHEKIMNQQHQDIIKKVGSPSLTPLSQPENIATGKEKDKFEKSPPMLFDRQKQIHEAVPVPVEMSSVIPKSFESQLEYSGNHLTNPVPQTPSSISTETLPHTYYNNTNIPQRDPSRDPRCTILT